MSYYQGSYHRVDAAGSPLSHNVNRGYDQRMSSAAYSDRSPLGSQRMSNMTRSWDSQGSFKSEPDYEQAWAAYGAPVPSAQPPKSSKKKWLWIGLGGLLALAIAGGVAGGILATRKSDTTPASSGSRSNNASPSSSSTSSTASAPASTPSSSSSGTATLGNVDDPSNFPLDSRLSRSFYAMAYSTPAGPLYPTCGDTLATILPQIQIMSMLTTRLRLYGMDCQQGELVLEAITKSRVNMTVYLGVYMARYLLCLDDSRLMHAQNSDETVYARQLATLLEVLQKYGTTHVAGVTVGNEYLLQSAGNGAAALAAAQRLVLANVADTRSRLRAAGYSLPVGSGDAGSMITATYAAGLDYLFANNHAFFSGATIQDSITWPAQYLLQSDPSVAYQSLPQNHVWQGEVGWPSQVSQTLYLAMLSTYSDAMAGGSLTLNGSIASTANLQYYIENYVCSANQNVSTMPYVWFQSFDSAYNRIYGGVEPYWGLFTTDNQLKPGLSLPTCISP